MSKKMPLCCKLGFHSWKHYCYTVYKWGPIKEYGKKCRKCGLNINGLTPWASQEAKWKRRVKQSLKEQS